MIELIRFHWRLALATTIVVAVCRLLLWCLPFRWVRRLGGTEKRLSSALPDLGRRHRIATAVRIVSAWVPGATCLTQALATQALLNCMGDHLPLQLGVKQDEEKGFAAHAWLESGGRILIGDVPDLYRYRRLEGAVPVL